MVVFAESGILVVDQGGTTAQILVQYYGKRIKCHPLFPHKYRPWIDRRILFPDQRLFCGHSCSHLDTWRCPGRAWYIDRHFVSMHGSYKLKRHK